MKMRWSRGKKHIDEDKVKMREQLKRDMRDLMLVGDEEGFVKLIKALRPDVTPVELVSLVQKFREDRRNV